MYGDRRGGGRIHASYAWSDRCIYSLKVVQLLSTVMQVSPRMCRCTALPSYTAWTMVFASAAGAELHRHLFSAAFGSLFLLILPSDGGYHPAYQPADA